MARTPGRTAFLVLGLLILTAMSASAPAQTQADSTSLKAFAKTLPGVMARSSQEEILLKSHDGRGDEIIVARTTRAPGTRTPLHTHDYGGTTCVLEGEMTLYRQDSAPRRAVAGQCYYMPSDSVMAGVNTGKTKAVMLDFFTVPEGSPVWKVVEESGKGMQDQFKQPNR